jgi:hypothetical protein
MELGLVWTNGPEPTLIHEDNQGCIAMLNNEGFDSRRTKHIDIRYRFTRELIEVGELKVVYKPTDERRNR